MRPAVHWPMFGGGESIRTITFLLRTSENKLKNSKLFMNSEN